MPTITVAAGRHGYDVLVERGALSRLPETLPPKSGRIFVITEQRVWTAHGAKVERALAGRAYETLFLPGGEEQKRLAPLEALAERMAAAGGDRSSVVVAFGGGIVNDMGGFLASIFMRGVPVIQAPTTLLAQVDASIGGKTGVNLIAGKNLLGTFHQPRAVLIDSALLDTLPDREYRAGLFEILKAGVIRSAPLFRLLDERSQDVLARCHDVVDRIIAESVQIKADVVSADEKESDLRRILNFGHTFGHALEAETEYSRYLHGEAVAWGMRAAVYLAEVTGNLSAEDSVDILSQIERYGPVPRPSGIPAERLLARMGADKKTIQGRIHFVVPDRIGNAVVISGVDPAAVRDAIQSALA